MADSPTLMPGPRSRAPLAQPEAIIVRTPNWLGDLLVATGFVQALLERFPAVPVHLIVRQGFETLPLPQRGQVLAFDRHAQSAGTFGRALRRQRFSPRLSHMFVLPPSFSSAWMAFRAGIPWRIGYRGGGRSWLLHPVLRHAHPPRSVHLLEEYLGLLRPWFPEREGAAPPLGRPALTAGRYQPRLAVTDEWIARHLPTGWKDGFGQQTGGPPPVVLAPGAEYGPAKQWPAQHYRTLALRLAQAGWPVLVAGLPQERALGDAILAGVPGAINLCGQTTLPRLVAVLARSALLVSNDSGAMHLAAALGRPQLALFGSTNPTWTGPLNPKAQVLYRQEWCSPCYGRTCRFGHTRCLTELPPESVAEQALGLLASVPKA